MGEQLMEERDHDDEWLIIATPDGPRAWNLGTPGRNETDLIARGRIVAGVPAHNGWVTDGSGYMVSITFGEPHATLLGAVGTLDELAEIHPDKVAEYQADIDEATRAEHVAQAAAYLAGMDPLLLAAVMAHPHVVAAVKETAS